MSGGGKQVLRGKMGNSISVSTDTGSAEEVNNLERRVDALESQLQQFREEERECEEVISRLGPEIRTMKMNIDKFTIEIQVRGVNMRTNSVECFSQMTNFFCRDYLDKSQNYRIR